MKKINIFGFEIKIRKKHPEIHKCINKLLKFKPIGVLTGEDDEWNECSGMRSGLHTYQNKRCFSVFKDVDAEGNIVSCHDIDGIICSDNGGITWFTTAEYRKSVTFPYAVPDKPEKIYLKELSEDERIVITDPDEIEALRVEKRREMDEAYARDKAAGWGQ